MDALNGECIQQAAPLVVPDWHSVDYTSPAGFPNGRVPGDPAIDITLAVLLLDVDGLGSTNGGHTAGDLIGLSQTADDGIMLSTFPFLAAP